MIFYLQYSLNKNGIVNEKKKEVHILPFLELLLKLIKKVFKI